MDRATILRNAEAHVRQLLEDEGSGHDWWHIHRVRTMAVRLAQSEHADLFLVELCALLHDVGDHKFHDGDENAAPRLIGEFLSSMGVDTYTQKAVIHIVTSVSYKGAGVPTIPSSIEGKIVQDADRLDAIGTIGIARAFSYGGSKGRLLYHPDMKPQMHTSFDEYKKSVGTTVNHFHEKLLLLKDRMHTASAKQLAQERHAYMEGFLERFHAEWDGSK